MYYIVTILHLPFFVLGFCIGIIGRPIMSGITEGYFFFEMSERLKAFRKTDPNNDCLDRCDHPDCPDCPDCQIED